MIKKLFTILSIAVFGVTAAQAQAPAFPGAEGHGRYVTGGRGGKVIHVTNLNDSGTGSLRAAVSGSAKKIVVFDVGGVIALKSNLSIGDNTTIACQTAPAPGITLRYYTVRPDANNVIIRFIRIRRGEEKDVDDGADAIWTRERTGMILDHCSFSWSIDEIASFYDMNNYTMQWCTLGESLNDAGHGKGAHGYGGIWGGKLASFHHNMITHVNNRSPRFCGARYEWSGYKNNLLYSTYQWANHVQSENVDFRNCVIYNWAGTGCYGGPGGGQINIVNNYYKPGPSKPTSKNITQVTVGASGNSEGRPKAWGMTSRYYINGNTMTSAGEDAANYDWKGVKYDNGTYTIDGYICSLDTFNYYGDAVPHYNNENGKACVRIKLDEPAPKGEVTTHTAEKAFEKVLNYAGASLNRDEVDARYAQEAKDGTATYTGSVSGKPGIVDRVADVKGYTEETFGKTIRTDGFDSDNDGMPDLWETANGLNPNDAGDANTYTLDSSKQWYTNLEVYLNSLVEDIMKAGNTDATETVDEYYPTCTKVDLSSTVKTLEEGTTPGGGDTPIPQGNNKTWNFSNWESGDITETKTIDGLTVAATNDKKVTIDSSKKTFDGVEYTQRLKFGGTGSSPDSGAPSRYLSFNVTGSCNIKVYFAHASSSGDARTLNLATGAFSNISASQSVEANNSATLEYNYTGNENTVYVYSANSGLNVYAIVVTYSSTGIHDIVSPVVENGIRYNLAGQRVDENYKGVVIMNGKKIIIK